MKTLQIKFKTLLILLLMSCVFHSCSSDDDSGIPTPENQAPNSFNLLEVGDGVSDVDPQPRLTWEEAIDPEGDPVSYDFYIGTENPPTTKLASGLTTKYYIIEDSLDFNTLYYWKVIAKDNQSNSTESNIASFKTHKQTNEELLIGKWFIDSIDGEAPLTNCVKKGFYQFLENGVILAKGYYEDNNGDCVVSNSSAGTYEMNTPNQIDITLNGQNVTYQIITITSEILVFDVNGTIYTFKKA